MESYPQVGGKQVEGAPAFKQKPALVDRLGGLIIYAAGAWLSFNII